jgi:L-alanine-DL-glutamate epimerase-like enolase superfamily enzyme
VRIAQAEFTVVSVPYTHRENSAQVNRDGVTSVIVKLTTDDGLVGWGESCSGTNVESVLEVLNNCLPILVGRDPWNRDAIWHDCFRNGLWFYRESIFNLAYPGIDIALWDLCGKAARVPLYNLLGGLRRREVRYFYYLSYSDLDTLRRECRDGVERGYTQFYRKVGVDFAHELEAMAIIREEIGPSGFIQLDGNEAWTVTEAVHHLAELDRWQVGYAEQPVPSQPIENMLELKSKTPVALAFNEGLWRVDRVTEVIRRRAADYLVFGPYWVGTIANFHRLSHQAAVEGLVVNKHTHGELGIFAAANQHVLLTLPRVNGGNQQTAQMMRDDVLTTTIPIAAGPSWGVPEGHGLGIEVDEDKVAKYHANYVERGQYMAYQLDRFGQEDPGWRVDPEPMK